MDKDQRIAAAGVKGFYPVWEAKHIWQFVGGLRPVRCTLNRIAAVAKPRHSPFEQSYFVYRFAATKTDERSFDAAVFPARAAFAEKLMAERAARTSGPSGHGAELLAA